MSAGTEITGQRGGEKKKRKKTERKGRNHHPKSNASAPALGSCGQVYMGHLLYYSEIGGAGGRKKERKKIRSKGAEEKEYVK